jgi:hypothetical protein
MNFDLVNYDNFSNNNYSKINNIHSQIIVLNKNNLYYNERDLKNIFKKSLIKNNQNNLSIKDEDIIRIIHAFLLFYFFFNYINKSVL